MCEQFILVKSESMRTEINLTKYDARKGLYALCERKHG